MVCANKYAATGWVHTTVISVTRSFHLSWEATAVYLHVLFLDSNMMAHILQNILRGSNKTYPWTPSSPDTTTHQLSGPLWALSQRGAQCPSLKLTPFGRSVSPMILECSSSYVSGPILNAFSCQAPKNFWTYIQYPTSIIRAWILSSEMILWGCQHWKAPIKLLTKAIHIFKL